MTANPDGDYWMTAQEVADELRLSVATLYAWRSKHANGGNHGPRGSKRGSRLVFRRSDVDAYIEATESATAVGGAVA